MCLEAAVRKWSSRGSLQPIMSHDHVTGIIGLICYFNCEIANQILSVLSVMRKNLLVVFFLFCMPFQSIAQGSVGFSDPDNIQPLLDYRLPEWKYTNFFLDFSLTGNFENRNSNEQQNNEINHQFSGQISPNYTRFRESEVRVSSYSLASFIDYSLRDRNSFNDNEQYESDLRLDLFWNFNEKFYRNDSDLFFTGSFFGALRQTNIRNEQISQDVINTDETVLNRRFTPNVSVGIGYGRLRNINPVIRSLRMNERLNALNTGQRLNQNDITEAADHFTRFNGYQQIYDRPQKNFWGDMDNLLSADLAALDAFDLLYLTDVTQEAIGSRREGWEIAAAAALQHTVNYSHIENEITNGSSSQTSTRTYLTPSVSGSWYKNLSLKHQIGINGSFQYQAAIDDESSFGGDIKIISTSANWLYTVTDRVLTNATVAYQRTGSELYDSNRISILSEINYFLEDRFSLFCNLRFVYQTNSSFMFSGETITDSIDRNNLVFDAGLRYYLKRGLF